MIKYMSNRFYNREMKPYRSNQAINPSKIAEIFSSISNMDTQEITNTANRLQIPLGVTDENGDTLIHKIFISILVSSKTKNALIWAIRNQYRQKAYEQEKFLEINIDKIFSNKTPIKNLVINYLMLLSNQKRIKIQEIIRRISLDKEVSLKERIYIEKYAKHSSIISLWLKKANSIRRHGVQSEDSINGLLQSLGIDGLDRENHFNPNKDDISDWFGGSPDWIKRS